MRNIFFLLFFLCVLSSTASANCDATYLSNYKCTSGDCTDGYGTLENSTKKYVGEFKNCKQFGWGRQEYIGDHVLSGIWSVGEWKNDRRHGYGITGSKHFSSANIFEYDEPTLERGVLDLYESICISGNCMNGYGTQINLGAEIKYVGEFKAGLFNGQGTLIFKKGTRYIGEFKDALINGQGIVSIYSGEWKLHQKHGLGTFVFADGTTVVAMWDNDDPIKLIGNENSSTSNSSNSQSLSISEGPSTSVSEWLSIAQQGFDMMSGTSSSGSSASQTCFKTGEIKQAFNKICNYKCGLTTYTHNLGTGVGLCPSTIQR